MPSYVEVPVAVVTLAYFAVLFAAASVIALREWRDRR